jgi:hypothetical protein
MTYGENTYAVPSILAGLCIRLGIFFAGLTAIPGKLGVEGLNSNFDSPSRTKEKGPAQDCTGPKRSKRRRRETALNEP